MPKTAKSTSWCCESCQTVPGVQKLLVRIDNIEARHDEIVALNSGPYDGFLFYVII